MRGFLAVVVTGLLLAGCGGGALPADGGEATLTVGATLSVGGAGDPVRLTLVRIDEDSRCGVRELCIQPGWVDARLTLSGGGAADQTVEARQGVAQDIPASGARPGFRITLTSVQPDKDSVAEPIAQSRYRIGLKIERLP